MIHMEPNKVREILTRALEIERKQDVPAGAAVQAACQSLEATDSDRKRVQELFTDALVSMRIGHGVDLHEAVLLEALERAGGTGGPGKPPKKQRKKEKKMTETSTAAETANENSNESTETIVENSTETLLDEKKGRQRKYNVGDRFQTVAGFGLQPTAAKDGKEPSVSFQFSRKTGRENIRDLPANTDIIYLGSRTVIPDQGGKKMVFKVPAGTLLLDGTKLENDVEVAGVPNHIDPEDGYNSKATDEAQTEAA